MSHNIHLCTVIVLAQVCAAKALLLTSCHLHIAVMLLQSLQCKSLGQTIAVNITHIHHVHSQVQCWQVISVSVSVGANLVPT